MARNLSTVAIETIEIRDVENLIGAEEGTCLEFKITLSTNDGQPDRWFKDQSTIGRVARDDIAKEIVAFANAYGGVLVVGVDETDDNPKRAKAIHAQQIPRVQDCAEQLGQALRSVIDPPIPMLELRGIVTAGDVGLIVIRVGASPSAPHGVGMPPAAYVRRGASSVPLTMRDQQSMFFERRTQIERVDARRKQQSEAAQEIWQQWQAGRLQQPHTGKLFAHQENGILFRCSLVPSVNMEIDNFPDRFLSQPMQSNLSPAVGQIGAIVKLPHIGGYARRYRCVDHVGSAGDRRYWRVSIEADGVIDQLSIAALATPEERIGFTDQTQLRVYPSWYTVVALQGMALAEWMRRWAGRPDVEYVLDGEFARHGDAFVCVNHDFQEYMPIQWPRVKFGPYSIANRDSFGATFDLIEREIWDVFGIARQSPLKFDWPTVLRSIGL